MGRLYVIEVLVAEHVKDKSQHAILLRQKDHQIPIRLGKKQEPTSETLSRSFSFVPSHQTPI